MNTMYPKTQPPTMPETAIGAILALMLASCAARTLDILNDGTWTGGFLTGFFSGHAGMQVFQNRVLAPLIALGIHHATGMNNADSSQTTLELGLYAAALVTFFGIRRMAGAAAALASTVITLFLFITLYVPHQGHMEDTLDVALLGAFVCAIYSNVRWPLLIPIFALQILNKETGLLIAVWLMMSSISFPNKRIAWPQAMTGALLFVAGFAFIHYWRTVVFHNPSTGALAPTILGQWWTFKPAIWNLPWMIPARPAVLLVAFALLSGPFLLRKRLGANTWQFETINLLMFASICCFGWIGESRVWIEAIPFAVIPITISVFSQRQP